MFMTTQIISGTAGFNVSIIAIVFASVSILVMIIFIIMVVKLMSFLAIVAEKFSGNTQNKKADVLDTLFAHSFATNDPADVKEDYTLDTGPHAVTLQLLLLNPNKQDKIYDSQLQNKLQLFYSVRLKGAEEQKKNANPMFILSGAPGVGKTKACNAISTQIASERRDKKVLKIEISGSTITDSVYVNSGQGVISKLKELIIAASVKGFITILQIDEIDSLNSRSAHSQYYSNSPNINSFLQFVDAVKEVNDVIILSTTNYLKNTDGAIYRSGRAFCHELKELQGDDLKNAFYDFISQRNTDITDDNKKMLYDHFISSYQATYGKETEIKFKINELFDMLVTRYNLAAVPNENDQTAPGDATIELYKQCITEKLDEISQENALPETHMIGADTLLQQLLSSMGGAGLQQQHPS